MNAAPEIKGWCPGAFRPMESGDGLLLRAKVIGTRLTAQQALAIAEISTSCGNGLIDLSQRAQLQLRGIREAALNEALRRLADASLLAPDATAERLLNIIAPPLAGLDRGAASVDALVEQLADALSHDQSLHELPPKFCFLVDDGAEPGLADVAADIRLEAFMCAGEARIAIVADGARESAIVVAPDQAVTMALGLARAFLSLRKGLEFDFRRMRLLVNAIGIEAIAREAALPLAPYRSKCHIARASMIFGALPTGVGWSAGVGAPFGRWRADNVALLAESALRDGVGELRLSPWRAILIPARTRTAAQTILEEAFRQDLIVAGDDSRLSIVACPGAPECPQALGSTRRDVGSLARLAKAVEPDNAIATLHISGCVKGCAKPSASPVTVVARGERFDLICSGRACDPPHLTGLALSEVEEALLGIAARQSINAARKSEEPKCPAR
jgi:precorrin-3B synthase